MKLSPHFTLEELTLSQTAVRRGLNNVPPPDVIKMLTVTAQGLEQVRALINCPITVSSGYRSPAVNQAVGSRSNSQHVQGQAADISAPGYGSAAQLVRAIVDSNIQFDQCVLEFDSWCHISFVEHPRRQALVINQAGTKVYT